jgi:beta-mannosidase
MKIPIQFTLGYSPDGETPPLKYVPASVPGNAQLDWGKAEGYPCFQYNKNTELFTWMEEVCWVYTATLVCPDLQNGEQVYFVSKGIDYDFEIFADGELLFRQEGMFTPVRLNLTKILLNKDGIAFTIFIKSVPKANESVKPPVSYGWDWHPRLVVSGLYEECYLEVKAGTHITDAEMRYVLSDDLTSAAITLEAEIENPNGKLLWQLFNENGKEVKRYEFTHLNEKSLKSSSIIFQNPNLWWPNEHGPQTLYTSIFTLTHNNKTEEHRTRVGFRRCKLIPNKNIQDKGFPKSSNLPPITMEINNRAVFCKGSNFVEPEIFTGSITRESYEPLIQLAKDAHFNMLRTWGGCMVSKEPFFDLCDELGLMVWQEFPLACHNYRDIPRYLDVLNRESLSIIKRVRRHVCLAMWSGGNELFNDWSGMNEQSHALRQLNANCYEHDRFTPFIPTSPIPGMGHGCYVFRYTNPHIMAPRLEHLSEGYDCLTAMIHVDKTAYTEFGCPSASDVETLKKIIPPDELFPPKPDGAWLHHHGFYAWHKGEPDSWLYANTAAYYFGEAKTLEELVKHTQLLQCAGYKGIYEEARRQWPHCSMALNWDYNEPWLTAAGNNLLTYPAIPKPAYHAVRESCRQQMVSARVAKFDYTNGENFYVDLFILNDLPETIKPLQVTATLKSDTQTYELGTWYTDETPPSRHQQNPQTLSIKLNEQKNTLLHLNVTVKDQLEMDSAYVFLCIITQ